MEDVVIVEGKCDEKSEVNTKRASSMTRNQGEDSVCLALLTKPPAPDTRFHFLLS